MKRNVVVLALAAGFALPAVAEESYTLDPVHSQPGFVVHHLGLSNQVGRFEKSTAKITLDREARTGTVDVTIDAASIRTFDPVRLDAIVKGEKYFNVENYPTITFRSNDGLFDCDRVVAVNGELTMRCVTRPVALAVNGFRCTANPFNKKAMCGAEATATIKRSDWGMTAGIPYAPADEVTLRIPIEAYRVEP